MIPPDQINQIMLDEINEATEDGLSGKLSPIAALFAIHSILNPVLLCDEDIEWAKTLV